MDVVLPVVRLPDPGRMTEVSTPRRRVVPLPDREGEMAVLEMGDPARPIDLVFVHANGFNALTYRSLLAPLAERFRILAPDLRGHGRTRLPTETAGRWSWHDHAKDLAALLAALDGPPVTLAGHSMGGTSGLLAAQRRPDRVSDLLLFDPVIWRRSAHLAFRLPGLRRLPARIPLVQGALKRRRTFEDRDQALAAYRGRGAFKGWSDDMIADYLEDGLAEAEGGGLTLACAPEWEASNYAAQSHDPWDALGRVGRPVRILKAATDSTCSATPDPGRNRTVEVVDGGTHFFPLVRPDVARAALTTACEAD